jgi:hypothetical protein
MAGSLVLNVEILGEFKKLTTATTGAAKDLNSLKKTTDKISKGMKTALGAIGLGFSLGVVVRELKEASKAAIEDVKSQELLALSLQASTKATDNQIAAVEKVIGKYQLQASVADDQLRPAFAKLTQSTGNLEESSKLLGIALDVSAGSGKSLDAVTQAMSKALEGSTGALERLLPAVKGVDDPMAFLEERFKGAASAASNVDPYTRMNILFGELQEQIGMALLPYLEDFSDWLAEPGTTEMLQEIVKVIVDLIKKFGEVISFVVKYKDVLIPLVAVVGTLTVAVKAVSTAMTVYNTVSSLVIARNAALAASNVALAGTNTAVATSAGAATAALRVFAGIAGTIGGVAASVLGVIVTPGSSAQPGTVPSTMPKPAPIPQMPVFPGQGPQTGLPGAGKPPVVVNQNITVNSASTNASGVVSSLQAYQAQNGSNIARLLK